MSGIQGLPSVHADLLAIDAELAAHESDLDVKMSPEVLEVLRRPQHSHLKPEPFINNLDGKRWYRIPFANEDFWNKRQADAELLRENRRRRKIEGTHFQVGDQVRFTRQWMRNTMQFAGPNYPCRTGPHARGTITEGSRLPGPGKPPCLLTIDWGDGHEPGYALSSNVEKLPAPRR